MSWVKIDNQIFEYRSSSSQLSINAHVSIYLDFDLIAHPEYERELLSIYDSKYEDMIIETVKYIGYGCKMKTLNINFNKSISISIDSDYIDLANIQERRDQNLEELLNKN